MSNFFDLKKITPLKNFYCKYVTEKMKEENLPSSYVPFINALSKQKFGSQQELTENLGCNKAHTSRTLFKMQLQGLIKPLYTSKIELSEKGKIYAKKLTEIENKLYNELSVGVTESEKQTFNKVLDKLIANANRT
ncbi:MAG: winged helix-turn-helix transcriptional regulator [Clostridiales bacterium]|nr:winged helix-turn-helix transcriptional regulator [Clostridiales bacterium]